MAINHTSAVVLFGAVLAGRRQAFCIGTWRPRMSCRVLRTVDFSIIVVSIFFSIIPI